MSDRRSAVFLQEMGVGPQWRLRGRAVPAAEAEYVADEAPAPEPAGVPAAVAAPMRPAAQPAPAAQMPPPVARPSAPAQEPPPAATQTSTPMPPPGVPPAPAPAAPPARVPGTPSIASTGEDMSWFDDAPAPAYQPQRKKTPAAPEQPSAAAPQSPVQAAPHARPAPAPAPAAPQDSAPDFDESEMSEPPSWFDDDAVEGAPSGAPAIADMDWPALQAAVSTCTRCTLCETRQQAIPGRGDEQATWLVLDAMPGKAEDAEGYQYAGDPGYLLDNMLKAVQQSTGQGAYLTSLVKCHADRPATEDELQACRPYLQRELELTGAKVILATGHAAAKGLLGSAARNRIMLHGAIPVVATYHPAGLLEKPEDKAKAWQDLCLAKAAHAGRR